MKDYYVTLTGGKNNAGDFLIKYRANELFVERRPDRNVVDFNAWEQIDKPKLEIINKAQALILMGGPALQRNMYPGIYKLPDDLDLIRVPIITMGIGWKSIKGGWNDTYDYPLNKKTIRLLDRIKSDGFNSSVRDFHTLNTLIAKGYDNFVMTGCPAYYSLDFINQPFRYPKRVNKVAFSLGVSFVNSRTMEKQMKNQILKLKEYFKDKVFEVVFHHALDPEVFLKTDGAFSAHNSRHRDFASWLTHENIPYIDISGNANNLISYYSCVDLHIGYRVHAHIFMNSSRKMSILVSEDGRGKGSQLAIGGMVVDGYLSHKDDFISKAANKLWHGFDRYKNNPFCMDDILNMIEYENKTKGQRSALAGAAIDYNYNLMSDFLKNLP
ncbi:polysaccharide pyruvyl transferase family protein [Stutzerimonas stutzeri]|uniref:polysaccharide pyruvyl transferase family protein n=1 Tax=Stutzerimonas stutzeri TaxID=316 RepID=UPI00265A8920|nr:polysaccharide pyruvyl transferase family protein [Stutzerimonas stutzeri]MCF6781783.1 polysaccharide pyruvyl transferase family protein [Stutzerimonas stutzeri]MCF6804452.1 polysaccharide pyruvyl transferase family protein [Stutzerimonas stutzeri]